MSASPAGRTAQLRHGPILPTLLRLAFPTLVLTLTQSFVGVIELYWIGMLGTEALAGVALVLPLLMLMQMMSAGAMGGGISSAVARALGSGRAAEADALAIHALAIAAALGVVFAAIMLLGGRALYTAMGAEGAVLEAATTYSDTLFAGIVLLWLFNAAASVLRGTGNMALPAIVTTVGALVVVPLSPLLIFGWGPLPRLGVAGGAVAVLLYYAVSIPFLLRAIWSGKNIVTPSLRGTRLEWPHAYEILRVGAVASAITVTTNLTVALVTAIVGRAGVDAIAGYGIGARLEYLLIPLAFSMGAPLVAMVGTAIGAGDRARALRAAWIGAAIVGALAELIGLAGAAFPAGWAGLFSSEPAVIEHSSQYLRVVGPFYGFFGAGMALYFASQGAGRMGGPLTAGLIRLTIAGGGGWLAFHLTGSLTLVFGAVALALFAFGAIVAGTIATSGWRARAAAVAGVHGKTA